jgi:hypothetical protein
MFYPGVGFENTRVFAHSYAQAGRHPLLLQKEPERERCFQAARTGHAVTHCSTNHATSLLDGVLAFCSLKQAGVALLSKALQPLLCSSITAQAQGNPDQGKKYYCAPKSLSRFGIQRSIPLE